MGLMPGVLSWELPEAERMRRSWIERITESIRLRRNDMTAHATEEMAEDVLDIRNVEHAV